MFAFSFKSMMDSQDAVVPGFTSSIEQLVQTEELWAPKTKNFNLESKSGVLGNLDQIKAKSQAANRTGSCDAMKSWAPSFC